MMMKKICSFFLALTLLQSASAQDEKKSGRVFKKFKTDISIGYAIPQGSGTKGGILFAVEPKYAVLDKLSVGIRLEGAALANVDLNGESGTVRILSSYIATGDYYFTNNKFRPFGGIGGGIYRAASIDLENSESTIPSSSSFGFMARAGFEAGHFRLAAEYNFLKEKSGYFGIKIGVCIGGGRKK